MKLLNKGARYLITGGTGFFGRHFTKYLLEADPSCVICIYSRSESKQAEMAEEFNHNPRLRFFIGDVRDADRLRRAMESCNIVVHAAALKRIEVGLYNPGEMVKTNVLGSMNVIEAAQDAGVQVVVALSTDKAFQPISAYGHSKAMAESLFLAANNTVNKDRGPKFKVVRYGNVAGSTGSVIPTWRKRITEGRGINVTDPSCTRFWMYADEAAKLVWGACTLEYGTDLIIPDLPAFSIGDLIRAMKIPEDMVTITGLGDHEKMHESMDFGKSSDTAERMNIAQLYLALERIDG